MQQLQKAVANQVSGSSSEMRGLQQYIADLRACRVRELEEKRINKEMAHIRQKFKDGGLDGYQKRKYLAKIIFTYILGYQVDIGHMEAVNLVSSTKYSEKQIGYLALTLIMHENSDIIRLVINSIRKDLDDMNDTNNCLALHAIANIGGTEMAESLAGDVHRLLISPTSKPVVKKKAALTLLRLYKKSPETIPAAEWATRLVSIMDDSDLGVALSVTSLISVMVQDDPEPFALCYQKAAHRLNKIVVDMDYPSDQVYYRVVNPWLQVKLLRLMQYYPPSDDPTIQNLVHNVLETILASSQDKPANVQHSNALNAVLFEAINLAIHLDTESAIVEEAAVLLGKFISSKETNVRYLGLDAMTHLAARSDRSDVVKQHQETIMLSLRDRDISVRRRGLDLLYSMCDASNAKAIVAELLKYLAVADYSLRQELVLKIAILTEKFAREYEWYIDTILRLISQAGDHVGDEVWYRVIQIVTNTEEIQDYAARMVYDHLRAPAVHESLIKIGAYILGEYGHLIANDEGMSPIEQFTTLHAKSNICSSSTRGLLLTTYLKWLNLFPEIREQIIAVLDSYRYVLDAELQQRACEYLAIANLPTDDILQTVADEMPPYPERESALLNRLVKRHGATGEQRAWQTAEKGRDAKSRKTATPQIAPSPKSATNGTPKVESPEASHLDSLSGLYITSDYAEISPDTRLSPKPPQSLDIGAADTRGPAPALPLAPPSALTSAGEIIYTHGAEKNLVKLAYSAEGVLFEDAQIQIGIKTEFHGHLGRLALYFGNKLSVPLESFTVTVESLEPDALALAIPRIPSSTVNGSTQIQVTVQTECKTVFTKAPIVRISYLAGSLQTITLKLPITINKFIEPVKLASANFFERWRQIGGGDMEAQRVFAIRVDSSGTVDTARNKRVISGSRLGLLDGVDPKPSNVVAAGVLHLSAAGKIGCLLRLEPNAEAKLCRLTVRSTNEQVSKALEEIIAKPLTR